MNIPSSLSVRETTGTMNSNILHKKITEKIIEIYNHEYIYDHPKLIDLLQLLISRIENSDVALNLLYSICLEYDMYFDQDISLVWVASRFGSRYNDQQVLSLCDDIKMETLLKKQILNINIHIFYYNNTTSEIK